MKQTTSLLTALAFAAGASVLSADPVESFLDEQFASLEESVPGKFSINSRLRYEEFTTPTVDDQGLSHRIRYGYTTPNFSGFTAMVEGETVYSYEPDQQHFLDDAGDGTDLNQLWVQYKDADVGSVKLGRQIFTLDDHRFIGHVGWRQNIQTFDALTGVFTGIENLKLTGFYIDEVHNVAGVHNDIDAVGVNLSYQFCKALNVTGFIYKIEGEDFAAQSNDTVGIRATGGFTYDESFTFKYAFSAAQQEDNNHTPVAYDADYFAGDIAATCSKTGVTLGAGFEILEAGFRTPLATVHKFNGFADVFAGASGGGIASGLEDYYAYAGYKIPVGNGIGVKAIYHWFSPETGAGDYGDEIDLLATYKVNKYFSLLAKYGDYESDGGSGGVGGVDKRMFTFEVNFVY